MELVRDAVVMRLVEQISEHYRTNISNRFIRPVLLQLSLDKLTWGYIEDLTEKFEQFRYQGFHPKELCRDIYALAKFVVATRHEIAPSLRFRISGGGSGGMDKVLRDMAVNNFSANLQVLADLLYELYTCVVEIDKANTTGKSLCEQVPEFSDIGNMLLHG